MEGRLRMKEGRQAFLLRLSDALAAIPDAAEIQETAARLLAERLGADRAAYREVAAPNDARNAGTHARPDAPGRQGDDRQGDGGARLAGRMGERLRQGKPVALADIAQDPRIGAEARRAFLAAGTRALLVVPLLRHGREAANLVLEHGAPRDWTAAEVKLAAEVAERARAAAERAGAQIILRQSEQRVSKLLSLMPAAVYTCDAEGRLTFFNRRAAELWGRAPRLDDAGERFCGSFRLWTADGAPLRPEDSPMAEALRDGRSARNLEIVLEQPGGARLVTHASIDPLYDDDGRLAGAINVFVDVTERKQAEAALQASEETRRRNQNWLAAQKEAFRAAMDGAALDVSLGILVAAAVEQEKGALRCAFYLADLESATLHHVVGMTDAYAERVNGFEVSPESLACGMAFASGQPVITPDVTREPRWRPWIWLARDFGYRACWFFPVETASGQLVGALAMYFAEPREPTARDRELAAALTQTAAIIISRMYAEAALRGNEAQLAEDLQAMEELHAVVRDLVGAKPPQALYDRIVQAAAVLMRSDAASIQVLDHEHGQLKLLAHRGFHPESARFWEWVGMDGASSCGRAYHSGDRVVMADLEPLIDDPAEVGAYRRSGLRAVQSTPLRTHRGTVLGMLSTHWRRPHRPSERELRFLDLLVRLAADLVERVQAEDRLRASEERLRRFGEASHDILWIRDAKTLQWQYLTPAFETIYGLGRDAAQAGDNYRAWIRMIAAEDRRKASHAMRQARLGRHVTFDYRIRRQNDGTTRWLRSTVFPITNTAERVTLIGGIGHDLTQLHKAGLRLQTLMEGIPQLVWRAIDGGHWTWSSPQWTDHTGLSSEDSAGLGWLNALHPDDRDKAMHFWNAAVRTGHLEMEGRIRHAATRQYRWFQTRATPVRDESGMIVEWLGTSTDIHELRELQERQKVLVAELQHRTRNLMGVVRSMADKIARTSTDLADFRERFHDRLAALARVQGLLSRLEEHDRVTFDDLIRTELSAMGSASGRVALHGPPGVRLRSSTVQILALALHELATNAVKYGALGQPAGRLAVSWRLQPQGGQDKPWLHIDWRESGVRMPPSGAGPHGNGQGRELIERALPYQLGARTSYSFGPDGVHCTISIPVSASTTEPDRHD